MREAPRRDGDRPLNVLVLSIGTRGDVQPFIYLGTELQSRGHRVTICALERYKDLVERHGLQYRSAGIDNIEESKFWRRSEHVSEVMADSIPNFCANFLKIGKALYDASRNNSAEVLVVTSTALSIALSISEKLNIPTFVVKFAPDIPTRAFPAPGYEGARSLRTKLIPDCVYNLCSWYHHWLRIGMATLRCKMGVVEDRYREEVLGLTNLKGGARLKQMLDCPNLCAFSEVVLPTPRDWPGNCLITGSWLPNEAFKQSYTLPPPPSPASCSDSSVQGADGDASLVSRPSRPPAMSQTDADSISPEVLSFLGSARDVICVTFGSMSPTADAIGLVPIILEMCEKVFGQDVKVLIVGSRFRQFEQYLEKESVTVETHSEEDLLVLSKPATKIPRVMVIDEAPYHRLFPLVRFVVHHGGAGTSASAIEACVPSLIIPILLWTDQPLWACQLQSIGVGFHVEQRLVLYPEDSAETKLLSKLPPRVESVHQFRFDCEAALRKLMVNSIDGAEIAKRMRVARTVAMEKGVEKAADAIEHLLGVV